METTKINTGSILNTLLLQSTCRQKLSIIIAIRLLLLALSALFVTSTQAQKIWDERKGCIRAQGNLAPGYLFAQKTASAYVAGDMDLFFDNKVSFTGSAFYSFALNRKNEPGLKANHAIFAGLHYHFLKPGHFDPYIGLTPGIGIVQANYAENETIKRSNFTAAPLISADIGFNYYIGWIFHVFVKVQGITGQMTGGNIPAPQRLDEIKCMAGLGWNIRAWKPKKKDNDIPTLIR